MTDGPGPRTRQPDPQDSRAVLIGASTYRTLESLDAVENNLEALHKLFTDPAIWGLPESHCEVLLNPTSPTEVIRAVHRAATAATDALVVYFAGHGLPDGEADLCLALPDADGENVHEALPYSALRSVLVHTAQRCYSKVVILDCCFSGRALTGVMSGQGTTQIADQARIDGTYLMTATAENRLALAPVAAQYTAFTGALIEKLTVGIPDGPDLLDMETLFYHVRADLLARQLPLPQQRSRNDGKAIALARNRHLIGHATPRTTKRLDLVRLPAHLDAAVMAKPTSFCDTVRHLDAEERHAFFTAAVSRRSHQQIAAIVGLLTAHGQAAAATGLLTAASRLAPSEVASVHHTLRLIGLTDEASSLLAVAATGVPSDVAELARALDHGVPQLLEAAANAARTRPQIVGLVSALWVVGLIEEVDRMLMSMAHRLPHHDVALLADDMRAAGHEQIAYLLYVAASEALSDRAPDELAQLVLAMRNAGMPERAHAFSQSILPTFYSFTGISALQSYGLSDLVDLAIAGAAVQLPLDRAVRLEEELHAGRLEELSLRLCQRVAMAEPSARVPTLLIALRDDGRPIDARRILGHLAEHAPPGDVAELVGVLHPSDARDLLGAFATRDEGDVTQLCSTLYRSTSITAVEVLPEFLAGLMADDRVSDRVLALAVRCCGADTLLDGIWTLPSANARRLLLVALAEPTASSLRLMLQGSSELDVRIRNLWGRPTSVHDARELLTTLVALQHDGGADAAQLILAAVMDRCSPTFLADLLGKVDGKRLELMLGYLRTQPEASAQTSLILRNSGQIKLARLLPRGR